MDEISTDSQHVINLAREVLNLAEGNAAQGLDLQERLLRSNFKLQMAAEGSAQYVIRKRHHVSSRFLGNLMAFGDHLTPFSLGDSRLNVQPLEFTSILIAIQSGLLGRCAMRHQERRDTKDPNNTARFALR